jgi:hypothetical protein
MGRRRVGDEGCRTGRDGIRKKGKRKGRGGEKGSTAPVFSNTLQFELSGNKPGTKEAGISGVSPVEVRECSC